MSEVSSTKEEFIVPPAHILKNLMELTKKGRILVIAEKAQQLIKQNEQWIHFGNHLYELSQEFDLNKIRQFLEQYYP